MSTYNFDSDNTLSGGLYGYSPREAIKLGLELCRAAEAAVGREGCHGGIWPGNISCADDNVGLGEPYTGSITDIGADAVEFVSPEQFWSGDNSPAADVYAIGMVMYTALNGGVMPFFEEGAERTPELRAKALQSRMRGGEMEYPKTACRELGDVVLKATAFKKEDRYPTPARLAEALEALPESAVIPAAVPVIRLTKQEVDNAHSYRVDKAFEDVEPEKPKKQKKVKRQPESVREDMDAGEFRKTKKSANGLVPIAIVFVAVVIALLLLMRSCGNRGSIIPDPTPTPDFPRVSDPVTVDARPTAPVATTPVNTPEPTPEATEKPIEERYKLVVSNSSWTRAKELCEQAGGHLATVKDEAELKVIIALAVDQGAQFVWLGSYRDDNGMWRNVTGEEMSFALWDQNEPSVMDTDGTREDYLMLWFRPKSAEWTYNDMRNDPVGILPTTFSGKTAYVCEFD